MAKLPELPGSNLITSIDRVRPITSNGIERSLRKIVEHKNPSGQVDEDFMIAVLSPRDASMLERPLHYFIDKLKGGPGTTFEEGEAYVRLLLTADAVLHQTELPHNRRRFSPRAVDWQGATDSKILDLRNLAKQELTQALDSFIPKSQEEILPEERMELLRRLNGLWSARTSFAFMIHQETGSHGMNKWINDSSLASIKYGKYVENLVFTPDGQSIDKVYRASLWLYAWHSQETEYKVSSQQLAEYFFNDDELQLEFWKMFASAVLRKSLFEHDFELPPFRWFLSQDQQIYDRFIESLRVDDVLQKGRGVLVSKGACLMAQLLSEEHPPAYAMDFVNLLKGVAVKDNIAQHLALFDVLLNSKPGIIYRGTHGESYARFPAQRQTKEAFLELLGREHVDVIYVSETGWFEPQVDVVSDPVIETKEVEVDSIWGKVATIDASSTEFVLEKLKTKAGQLKDTALFDQLTDYAKNKIQRADQRLILIPSMLGTRNYLRILDSCGIEAVDQQGTQVSILISPSGYNVSKGVELLRLTGTLNASNELQIDNAPEEFNYSGLHLLLNCAALYARLPVVDQTLYRDEVAMVRQLIKDWKSKGHHAELAYDANPTSRRNAEAVVVCPVGSKKAFLHFA